MSADGYEERTIFTLTEDETVSYVHTVKLDPDQHYVFETHAERAIVCLIGGVGQIATGEDVTSLLGDTNVEVPPHSSYHLQSSTMSDSPDNALTVSIYGVVPASDGN